MNQSIDTICKWLKLGLSIKRWLALVVFGILMLCIGFAELMASAFPDTLAQQLPAMVIFLLLLGVGCAGMGLVGFNRAVLKPFRMNDPRPLLSAVYAQRQHDRGLKVVAIGGGTGLPSVLRGMKQITGNITAIVTVADDGGSSGRLRRDMAVLPPGDLRNNIAALASDEDLMTQLFQYRFSTGELDGHSFGNLLLTALSDITGGMDLALQETQRVLAVQGSVLPATMDNVTLHGEIRNPTDNTLHTIVGESEISAFGGRIERISLNPPHIRAYPRSVQAILEADLIVIGPGSLYTSILPSLLISGIADAIKSSAALSVYICNVATQPGETTGYDVADHVIALEQHVGQHILDGVIANNTFPDIGDSMTQYVAPIEHDHPLMQRYQFVHADLTDGLKPWRHDPAKLAVALQQFHTNNRTESPQNTA